MRKKFIRCKEDFVCENCNEPVKGNGYTNHCPNCLYSKHVDRNPGDRLAQCGGMMRPVGLEKNGMGFVLIFVCEKCGHKKRNRTMENDNMDVIIEVSKGNLSKRRR